MEGVERVAQRCQARRLADGTSSRGGGGPTFCGREDRGRRPVAKGSESAMDQAHEAHY